jgi:hypothetical protein
MEAEIDALLLKISQIEALQELKSRFFDESLELLEDIFGDEELAIEEDWNI